MATANPVTFLQQVKVELSKVVWPTRAETIRLTTVVIGVSVAVGLIIGGLDVVFTKMMELILQR